MGSIDLKLGEMDTISRIDLSCVIPCFNEADIIVDFAEALTGELTKLDNLCYEIIFIDDGSQDDTLFYIESLHEKYKVIEYISFSRNFGKEAAIYAGLLNARGELTVIMDADFQDPPKMIVDMYEFLIMNPDYDCVGTFRIDRKGEPIMRSFFSSLFYSIVNIGSQIKINSGVRDFRMMRRQMVDAVLHMSERNRFSKGIFEWVGFRTKYLPYENIERQGGKTSWDFSGLTRYAVSGIVNFSAIPLGLISGGGILSTGLSLILMFFLVIRKLLGYSAAYGWTSMVCIMLLIGGIQMLSIGMIGHYIARIYEETKQRPHFIANKSSSDRMKMIG